MEASDWLGLMADILPVQWSLVAGQKETGVTFSENKPLVIFLYSLIRSDRSDQMSDCERFT